VGCALHPEVPTAKRFGTPAATALPSSLWYCLCRPRPAGVSGGGNSVATSLFLFKEYLMANRFNAVGYSEKHLDDEGRFHFGFAHIRPADQGVTDVEFNKGVRVIEYDYPSRVLLVGYLEGNWYEVLNNDEWNILIKGDDTDSVDCFKYPTKADKWDAQRPIY
jgi:hypothetical protein